MKKALLSFAILLSAFAMNARAQYYTYRYDPFRNGDKYIGLSVGMGGWLSGSDFYLHVDDYNTTSPYFGFQAEELSRSIFNPSVMFNYKRVLEGRSISWANNIHFAFSMWNGEVKGTSTTNPALTFTTKYRNTSLNIADLYYAIIHIGDKVELNVGGGVTIGYNFNPKSTISYSDGREDVETSGGLEFMDLMSATIDFMVGADYRLSDVFSLNCNFIGHPIDFFGLGTPEYAETKGMRGVGEGLFVTKKFPFHLTIGFTYAL